MAAEFDQNAQLLDRHMTEIKSLLSEISSNTKRGATGSGGGGSVGPSGKGGRSAIAGGSARRGRGFSGALSRKLLGKAPLAIQAGAAVGGAIKAAVVDPIKKATKEFVLGGVRNAANFGSDANAFQGAFNAAKSNIPIIGQGVSRVLDPINRAAQRTNAVTSMIARGGGVITDDERAQLGNRMLKEEQRAQKDIIKNQKFFGQKAGSDETTAAVNKELIAQLGRLIDAIGSLFGGG
jgi:hypothetical protein